ncbi:hypothetical protein DL98DRAFT_514762 [Cadophora sp. DSE1049]|nr:hypothetical protein DL98DRAFT_514762 [Cadophora sp. DSE1049]
MATSNTSHIHFPLFPLLPTEIRLKIWQQALEQPRLLPIRISYHPDTKQPIFHCSQLPPRLLSVCRESRDEALHFHILVNDGGVSSFYFNSQTDTVSLRRPDSWLQIVKSLDQRIAEAAIAGQDTYVRSLVLHHKYMIDHFWPMSQLPTGNGDCGVREVFFTVADLNYKRGYLHLGVTRTEKREAEGEVWFMPIVERGLERLKTYFVDAELPLVMAVQT